MHEAWSPWLRSTVQRQPGRALAFMLGVALLAVTLALHVANELNVWLTGLFGSGGLLLVGIATLPIKRFRLPGGGEVETHDQGHPNFSDAVDQIRKERPAAETVDLPGDDLSIGVRYLLGERIIEHLLSDLQGPLAGCEARIFIFDSITQLLITAYRPSDAGPSKPGGWHPGQGVTGAAYSRQEYVVATGAATHDDTWELDEEQQERYRDLTAVAATPIWASAFESVLGVLSLSSKQPDTQLATDEGFFAHVALAEQVAVAMEDLLGFGPGS